MKHRIVVRMLNARAEASQRLGELLEKVHAKLPKVDEEEAEQLINDEVTKMRAASKDKERSTDAHDRGGESEHNDAHSPFWTPEGGN